MRSGCGNTTSVTYPRSGAPGGFFSSLGYKSLKQVKVGVFLSGAKLLVNSCPVHTNFVIFFNGNDYSMVILLLPVLLAYVRYFIWFSMNTSLRNIGTLDLNVTSGHWSKNSCENVASHG